MSMPENTSKNRKLLDEVRDVMDGDEYLNIEVGLFALWMSLVSPVVYDPSTILISSSVNSYNS
jgi:hypothetical protein